MFSLGNLDMFLEEKKNSDFTFQLKLPKGAVSKWKMGLITLLLLWNFFPLMRQCMRSINCATF